MGISLLGQASGQFNESTSALRILHVGVRNSLGQLTADAFTQTNPGVITTAGTTTTAKGFAAGVLGVLSGSIAFTRPDEGAYFHGGPTAPDDATNEKPLGIFINHAVGYGFTNQPGVASNRGPYVSAQGTYGNSLYETQYLVANGALGAGVAAGDDLPTYTIGQELKASLNGFLTNSDNVEDWHDAQQGSDPLNAGTGYWLIGILTVAQDSSSDEIVYDQRI